MSARILDGTAVAATIRAEVAPAVASFTQRAGRRPRLTLVLVGDAPSSELYVHSKLKSAGETGLDAQLQHGDGLEPDGFEVALVDVEVALPEEAVRLVPLVGAVAPADLVEHGSRLARSLECGR